VREIKILVTAIGGDIGQSVIRCLRDVDYGQSLIGCDIDAYAASRLEVKEFHRSCPARDELAYKDFIEAVLEKDGLDYIIPTTESEIRFFNKHRDSFKDKAAVLINRPFIVDTFFDKYKTYGFLKDNGFDCPATYLIEDYNGDLPFPVLLKERHGYGRKGMLLIDDMDELGFYRKKMKDTIVQEVVGDLDHEYTVGVFSDGQTVHSIAFQRYLGYGSLSKIARLVDDEGIYDIAEKIARAADLKGSFNIQLRKTAKGYLPLEVNPRLSSTVYIRHYFGFRDVQWWLDLYEKRPIAYMRKYKSGVGVRRLSEIFYDCK
jgi:carbamoyl-phosphate synthase large subunit